MSKIRGITFLFLITILSHGCAYLGYKAVPKPEVAKKDIIEKYIKQQLDTGDENFKKGNYKLARRNYLTTYFIDPQNDLALEKLRRLPITRPKKTAKPSAAIKPLIYTGEHTIHTVKPGDTLAIIAKKYYGDYKKYSMLAETNKIKPPYEVHKGQSIIVPKSASGINLEESKKRGMGCFQAKDYDCSIRELTGYLLVEPDDEEIKKYLRDSYFEEISINFNNNNYEETSNLLMKIKAIASRYKINIIDISYDISQIENSIELFAEEKEKMLSAEKLLSEGKDLQENGTLNEAKDKYQESLLILKELEYVDSEEKKNELMDFINVIDSVTLQAKIAKIDGVTLKYIKEEEYEEALEKVKEVAMVSPDNKGVSERFERINNIVGLIGKAKVISEKDPEQAFLYYLQAYDHILENYDHKSSLVEKEMIYSIHRLMKIAENKLNAEDPCGSLNVLDMINTVDDKINIPFFIKNELKKVYSKSSSLKEALNIKCKKY
jgi:LysM repeat protein